MEHISTLTGSYDGRLVLARYDRQRFPQLTGHKCISANKVRDMVRTNKAKARLLNWNYFVNHGGGTSISISYTLNEHYDKNIIKKTLGESKSHTIAMSDKKTLVDAEFDNPLDVINNSAEIAKQIGRSGVKTTDVNIRYGNNVSNKDINKINTRIKNAGFKLVQEEKITGSLETPELAATQGKIKIKIVRRDGKKLIPEERQKANDIFKARQSAYSTEQDS